VGWFDRFRRRAKPSGSAPSARTLNDLKEFMASRHGVEALVEPPTPVYAMTLCLVAADGEHIRRPVRDERQARSLCKDAGVPLYDARIVGYPRRMREYERGVRRPGVSLDDLPPLDVTDHEPGED
jgi:hypothetical protein